jgi:glycosyltransferase involved in cell wall biosynthesis
MFQQHQGSIGKNASRPRRASVTDASNRTRLLLCMIVKNEAAVLRRCLDAALPHVDGFVLADTGSTDATVEIAEQSARERGISIHVVRHQWQDFGHNRTLCAKAARTWAREQAWPLGRTYLLFLDADMLLRVDSRFDKSALTETSYLVKQLDDALHYYNTRLACLSHEWRSVGVTHEYWEAVGGCAGSPARLEHVRLEHRGDGGSRGDKFERDIRLLRDGLEREPDNTRYMFYLAQSYFDIGRWTEAADWYARRSALGGWAEERWYARYRQGLALLRMEEFEKAASVLLDAFELRPTRAEPLHALARHYRERGKNQLAFHFAERALAINEPDDILFVSKSVYDWQIWEEIMISAYYAGKRHWDLGLRACELLLARRGHESWFYDYVARNESFYLPRAQGLRRGTFAVSEALRTLGDTTYACSNPTIVEWRGRTFVNVRLVNYSQERGKVYRSRDRDHVVRSRNVAAAWDQESDWIAGERESSADFPRDFANDTAILGLEDVRWIVHRDRVWFTATCFQTPGAAGRPQVVAGFLNEDLDRVERVIPLVYRGAGPIEKNWVPWVRDGILCVIYSYDPFVVLSVDETTGHCAPILMEAPKLRAARFRGATSPVRVPGKPGRFVAIVHEVAEHADERIYSHRWVEIDRRMGLVRYSAPFTFDHRGIEYATGLSCRGDKLVVTYGWEDREARWIEFDWDIVRGELSRNMDFLHDKRASETEAARVPEPPSIEQQPMRCETDRADLDCLVNRYGSDKDRNGYTHVYHALFQHLRDRPLKILEVGIGTVLPDVPSSMAAHALPGYRPGGSLRAWRDYFPQADVHGMDVQPDTQFSENRIRTHICDSTAGEQVASFFRVHDGLAFDVIIDDGSHVDVHQLRTLENLYPHLKPGGYYIIEDVYPGSGLLTKLWDEVRRIVRGDFVFVTEAKNLVVISRRPERASSTNIRS